MTDTRYYRISPKFWADPMVVRWSDDAKLVALYLLTCSHRTMEGLFRFPKAYGYADLGWGPERFDKAFTELLGEGFIEYDEDVQVVLIRSALKWQAPANPNQAKSAVRKLLELPETPLMGRFQRLAERFSERLVEALPEGFGEPQALTHAPSQAQTPPPKPPDDPEPVVDENAKGGGRQTKSEVDTTVDAIRHGLPEEANTDRRSLENAVRPLIERGWTPQKLAERLLNMKSWDGVHSFDAVLRKRCEDLADERSPAEIRAEANRGYEQTKQMLDSWKSDEERAWGDLEEVG